MQKIALDHPYFDTPRLPLTEKEAKAIVKANIKMTGREFVDSVYANLGMTRPEEEKKRFAWLRSVGELFTVPPIRRIAIAVLVVILMTVFFAATPAGRAIAESIIRYFVSITDDGTFVMTRSDEESHLLYVKQSTGEQRPSEVTESDPNEIEIVSVNSFDEFMQTTGKVAKELPLPYNEFY